MTRTETLRQSVQQATAQRLAPLTEALQAMDGLEKRMLAIDTTSREALDTLAEAMVPVARALVTLAERSREAVTAAQAQAEKSATKAAEIAREIANAVQAAKAANREARATVAAIERAVEAATARQRSAWIPALVAAIVPTLAVGLLAWRAGLLR